MTVGTGRLTLPAEEDSTSEQRRAADLIAAGPRGALLGPFVPLLHNPELMTRLQLVGEYLRFQKVLDDGYYTALALVTNVARTPAPDGAPALTVNIAAAGDDDR